MPSGLSNRVMFPKFNSIVFVEVTYGSLIPDIQPENLPGISGAEDIPQIGDMLVSNQDSILWSWSRLLNFDE